MEPWRHHPRVGAMYKERVDPNTRVWRGNGHTEEQEVRDLGIPIGSRRFREGPAPRNHRETQNFFRTSSMSARSAECVAPASVLRQHKGNMLFAGHLPLEVSQLQRRTTKQHGSVARACWVCLPPPTDKTCSLLFGQMPLRPNATWANCHSGQHFFGH